MSSGLRQAYAYRVPLGKLHSSRCAKVLRNAKTCHVRCTKRIKHGGLQFLVQELNFSFIQTNKEPYAMKAAQKCIKGCSSVAIFFTCKHVHCFCVYTLLCMSGFKLRGTFTGGYHFNKCFCLYFRCLWIKEGNVPSYHNSKAMTYQRERRVSGKEHV